MKKKILIIIIVLIIVLLGAGYFFLYTDLGNDIRSKITMDIISPKEVVSTTEEKEKITITYTYLYGEDKFDLEVTDKDLIEKIDKNLNKKLNNYSSQIGLAIFGTYTVKVDDNISFKFDNYDSDGYVSMCNGDKRFLTQINPEILKKVVDITDIELTKKASIFNTDKITITKNDTNEKIDITRKTVINYILNQCKLVSIKDINYEPNIVRPDYEISFNNGVKLWMYKSNDRGFMVDEYLHEAYGISKLDDVLEVAFENIDEREKPFLVDEITIVGPKKEITIKDKEKIEKITSKIIYSKIQGTQWLDEHDLTEEYNGGIKIKINGYEYLIPGKLGTVTIGNRYLIYPDGSKKLCFSTIGDLEEDMKELLK